MEESYDTFKEELWPPRVEPLPQKPVPQVRKPEMHASRMVSEEGTSVPQQLKCEPKSPSREPGLTQRPSLRKSFSIQNLTQIETPWENVTLNRCLFVAITILVISSGFHKIHEAFRGEGSTDEAAMTTRSSLSLLRHKVQLEEPESSLWDIVFSWLPKLDDNEDDEDDNKKLKKGKPRRGVTTRELGRLRNRPIPDKNLLKQKNTKVINKKARTSTDQEVKDKNHKGKRENPKDVEDKKIEDDTQIAPKQIMLEEKKAWKMVNVSDAVL